MERPATKPCRLFLFDLDGTLIDSCADITLSLNLALDRLRLPRLHASRAAAFIGNGVQRLVERSREEVTGRPPDRGLSGEGVALFREEYARHILDRTRLLPGVKEGLDRLAWALFAVVSNKPEDFCRRILEGLGIGRRFRIILGGDSVPHRKPDPGALIRAMEACGVPSGLTAMVGDSPVDIGAGRAAGVTTCGVLGGFHPKDELEAAGCDLILPGLAALADHFHEPPGHWNDSR